MGYWSTRADPDVWIWEAVKPDGHKYYKMLLIYVDDILAISHQPQQMMSQIQELYCLKDDSIGPPPSATLELILPISNYQMVQKPGLHLLVTMSRLLSRILRRC